MSNLESTRAGWVLRGIGMFAVLLAIGLTIGDLITGNWAWPINLVTAACGIWIFHVGTRDMRRARSHHEFMERHRTEIARLRRELGES